jgi:hypothetical protein
MSSIVGILYTSHGGFTSVPSSYWAGIRADRSYRDDVPMETQEEMDEKWARTEAGKDAIRDKLSELRPDVLVIFGDDQQECFDFNNHPSLAVYMGAEFSGKAPLPQGEGDGPKPRADRTAPGHPGLATAITVGLMHDGFDPAFMMDLPRPDHGMAHAIMKPLTFYTDFDIPTVPILINAYYAPQITALRCYQVGKAVRKIIESYPEDLRVVVMGSGGLWHTPGQEKSWLNEEFDRTGLALLQEGRALDYAKHFDNYKIPEGDNSQDAAVVRRGVTGLPIPGGPQGGTRETLCWICASAVGEGQSAELIDYVPIYASPVGNGFAFSTEGL